MKPQLPIFPLPHSWTEIKTLFTEAVSLLNKIINNGEGTPLTQLGQDLGLCVHV